MAKSHYRQATHKKPAQVKVKRAREGAGLGLFADEPLAKDSFIIEYVGEIISSEEADRRGGKYLFDLSSRRVIDGKARENTARYINHSCKPNCETEISRGRVFVYAKRNIKEGEELSFDYGKEYVDEFIKPYGCKCDACVEDEEASKSRL